jgi:hypothetical protein
MAWTSADILGTGTAEYLLYVITSMPCSDQIKIIIPFQATVVNMERYGLANL